MSNYKLSKVNDTQTNIDFKFDNIDLTEDRLIALKNKQKEVELKGFRKGKAPLDVVEKFYGSEIQSDAIRIFVSKKIDGAINTEKLKPIDYPSLENFKFEENSLSFTAVVEVVPVISIPDYKAWKFQLKSAAVSKEEIDNEISRLLKSKEKTITVEDKNYQIVEGDIAVVNFQGTDHNGLEPANMSGEGTELIIGSNQFIPGFETGLINHKAGEKVMLDLSFPKDYHIQDLAGKPVKFNVEIISVKTASVPELDDALAIEFGFNSQENMKNDINKNLADRKVESVKKDLENDILEMFLTNVNFVAPKTMVNNQKKSLEQQFTENMKRSRLDDNFIKSYISKMEDDFSAKAEKQIKSALVLEQLSKDLDIKVEKEDFEQMYKELSLNAGMDFAEVEKYYKNDSAALRNLFFVIKEKKTFEKIKAAVKISQ
jgi:trigger factor